MLQELHKSERTIVSGTVNDQGSILNVHLDVIHDYSGQKSHTSLAYLVISW